MKYNSDIQKAADAFARKEGYLCAVYLGPTDESLVFQPREEDNEPRCTGLPTFIIYKNDDFQLDRGLNFHKYTDKIHYTYRSKKGKVIFDIYEQMYANKVAASEEDLNFIHQIISMSKGQEGYRLPVPKGFIYEALEIADRLNMTIEFYPCSLSSEIKAGRYYFIRIVPGKLPKQMTRIID